MRSFFEWVQVQIGAFASSFLVAWFISGQVIPSLLVGGIVGGVAGFIAARFSTPRYTKE